MKAAFLQDNIGNYSLSRLIVFICICTALVFSTIILYLGREDVLEAAEAIAMVFGAIAIPSLTFLFGQKKNEAAIEINAKEQDTLIEQSKTEIST